MKKKIEIFKKPLNNEQISIVEYFIQFRKNMIKDEENKEVRNKAWELEEKLEKQGFLSQDIERLIKYCERSVDLDQQLEQLEVKSQVEILSQN